MPGQTRIVKWAAYHKGLTGSLPARGFKKSRPQGLVRANAAWANLWAATLRAEAVGWIYLLQERRQEHELQNL